MTFLHTRPTRLLCWAVVLLSFATSCADPAPEQDPTTGQADGTQSGACYGNRTCNYGLFCNAQDLCEIIPGPSTGERGGACLPNGGCDVGLSCRTGNICLPEDASGSAVELGDETPIEVDEIIVGEVNWDNIQCDPNASGAERWACSVGYLSINNRSRCTAWLVSPSVIATNNHCIASQEEISQVIATFNFEQGVELIDFDSFICEDFLATSPELDLTLLGCSPKNNTPPGSTHGWLEIDFDSPIRDDEELAVIHQNCIQGPLGCEDPNERPDKKLSLGRVLLAEHTPLSFRHSADTLGGSSGSPVIDANTGKVRGIHFAGVKSQGFNIATSAAHFLRFKRICDVLNPGDCETGEDLPPGQTKIQFRTFEAFTDQPFTLFVRPGTDPNAAEDVQTRCASTEDSSIPPTAPYTSPWGQGGSDIETTVTWSTPGQKTIQCTTVERDGDSSTTVAVLVDVQPAHTTGDAPPAAPELILTHTGAFTTQTPISFFLVGSTDPEGTERVQNQCFSEGSNWTQASPFATPLDLAQRNSEPTFTWTTPGNKTVTCVSVEEDGQTSRAVSTTVSITSGNTTTDNPPSAPTLWFLAGDLVVGRDVFFSVTSGTDPEETERTQIQCSSEGSNWTPEFPFATPLDLTARSASVAFAWDTPGTKTVSCLSVEEDGHASSVVTTSVTIEDDVSEDLPPAAPSITVETENPTVDAPVVVTVVGGADPEGQEEVQVQCFSEGSNWTDTDPFFSSLSFQPQTVSVEFTWTFSGQKTITCFSIERDGQATFTSQTIELGDGGNTGEPTPTRPNITAPASTSVGTPTEIQIQAGQDPNDPTAHVRVQCISPDSQWVSGSELSTDFGPAFTTYAADFTWASPGQKTIFCSTVTFNGSASASEIATIQVQ